MSDVDTAQWAAASGIAGAVLAYLGVRYTARTSKQASEHSAVLNAPEVIFGGYDRLNEDLWQSIRDLREQAAANSEAAQVAREKAEELQGRVTSLERREAENRRWREASVQYIRRLLDHIQTHAPDAEPPQPPRELEKDLNHRKDTR